MAGGDQLALDVLKDIDGQDADLLRIDAHWKAKRYSHASELIETMVAAQNPDGALGQTTRMNIIKAGVGFVLNGDAFGAARLRAKFAERMVTTPEWPIFDYVTGTISTSSLEFKKVARDVAGMDSLNAFIEAYRQTYGGEGALTPAFASKGDGAVASAQ